MTIVQLTVNYLREKCHQKFEKNPEAIFDCHEKCTILMIYERKVFFLIFRSRFQFEINKNIITKSENEKEFHRMKKI